MSAIMTDSRIRDRIVALLTRSYVTQSAIDPKTVAQELERESVNVSHDELIARVVSVSELIGVRIESPGDGGLNATAPVVALPM